MAQLADLGAFDLSPGRGFLPDPDPVREPGGELGAWDELGHDLPRLIPSGRLRSSVESLPALRADRLTSDGELRRAMLLLSFVGHAYVWCEDPPAPRLPRSLAVPWAEVASRLGRPPVLSYASYALDNWRLLDPEGAIELGNVALLQNFLGGADEDWFILVHVAIEAEAAAILRQVAPALEAAERDDTTGLTRALESIATACASVVGVLQRMPEYCDPYIYYTRARPFIHGWANHPALPQGLVYEGVFDDQPRRFRGETGAQSGIVPTLDALLAVPHAPDPLRAHLNEMREYMPPGHRAWVEAIEHGSQVRTCVERNRDAEATEAYDACLEWLHAFRATHLDYASRYIHEQAEASRSNPAALGTGGTPFMPYLRKHRDETAMQRLGRGAR